MECLWKGGGLINKHLCVFENWGKPWRWSWIYWAGYSLFSDKTRLVFCVMRKKIGNPGRTKFSYMMGGYHDMIYVILFKNEALWGTPDSINSQSVLVETIRTHHCWQNVQFDWIHCDCWLYIIMGWSDDGWLLRGPISLSPDSWWLYIPILLAALISQLIGNLAI